MAKAKVVRLRRQDQLYIQIPTLIIIVIAICFALLPTIITWLNSVKTQSEINLSIMSLPEGLRWQNYVDAFEAVKTSIMSSLIAMRELYILYAPISFILTLKISDFSL